MTTSFLGIILGICLLNQSFACSMIKVLNCDGTITARTMDFDAEMYSKISIVPKESPYRFGATKFNFIGFDGFGMPAHGVNEKGLCMGLLWLNETKYPTTFDTNKTVINVLEFLPFVLGNYQSVKEVVDFFKDHDIDFINIPEAVKKQDLLHQHIYVIDSEGNTLLLEWLKGKLKMYINETPVLVNSPDFEQHKKIWQKQLKTQENIVNWEYNLIEHKMHDADTRYQMLRRLTEQSLPTKGIDNITKAFQIMKRVSYIKITPYMTNAGASWTKPSWTLYTTVLDQTRDNVKIYYNDYNNPAIRFIDFNKIDWKQKKFDIASGDKYIDMNETINNYK